jgi:hypothetical protein
MVNTVIKKTTQTDKPVQLCATHSRRVERHDHRPVHETAGDQPRYVFLTQNGWQPLVGTWETESGRADGIVQAS